ncbi:putative RNA-binding protein (virulence factor B family) [Salibacterium salarium]|uniref:CvfB family protein n=1 Tax=Salibacterium salarium TaxID=284579 RepID=UPI00278885E2|nr:S1-like domain-containing RNA-binding protein [Salibacterium salarium]MDQ0299310.1 putative RNA-binding protein (virulence factor B family) [Salibacterium salarium]
MIKPGTIQTWNIKNETADTFTLTQQNDHIDLPVRNTTRHLEVGEDVRVFIYTDKLGKPQATMTLPEVTKDSFGFAPVVNVVPSLGVFLDIGAPKDLLVSKDDLPYLREMWPQLDDQLYSTLIQDKQGRLFAKPATEDVIMDQAEDAPASLKNQTITGFVYRVGKVGSFIWTTDKYRAFLHESERTREPRLGEAVEARVIDVKEDGTINVSFRPNKLESMDKDSHAILLKLTRNQGELPFSDKSDPEDIKETFEISKAAFKRALGRLMKQDIVEQTKEGTIKMKD